MKLHGLTAVVSLPYKLRLSFVFLALMLNILFEDLFVESNRRYEVAIRPEAKIVVFIHGCKEWEAPPHGPSAV